MGGTGNPFLDGLHPDLAYDSVNQRFLVAWSGDQTATDAVLGDTVDEEFEIYGRLVTVDLTVQSVPLVRNCRLARST
jgi:hypothetical protein